MIKKFGFSHKERLHYRRDFQKIITTGNKISGRYFLTYWITNISTHSHRRLGLMVSRKIGKAVKRNRIKRWIREFFRLNKWDLPAGTDIVIYPRPPAISLNHKELDAELKNIWEKINEKNY